MRYFPPRKSRVFPFKIGLIAQHRMWRLAEYVLLTSNWRYISYNNMREAIILMALLYAYIAQYSAQTRHNALNIAQLRGMQRCPPSFAQPRSR